MKFHPNDYDRYRFSNVKQPKETQDKNNRTVIDEQMWRNRRETVCIKAKSIKKNEST